MADVYVCIKDLLAAARQIFNSVTLLSNSIKYPVLLVSEIYVFIKRGLLLNKTIKMSIDCKKS